MFCSFTKVTVTLDLLALLSFGIHFFFKHSWWRHILNRVKQPHDWWGQHNFVLADGVRFKVSSDTSSNHVAYTLYNWQDREHLGMNIPRPERKAERVGGCILSAVAHSCKYCTFVLANNHVTQPSIDSKKWQESTSRVRPCALRVQLYVPLLAPLHPTPCSQPQAFLPSCTQSRQRNWIVCSRLPDKHALLAGALIGCSMGPGYFASNRRVYEYAFRFIQLASTAPTCKKYNSSVNTTGQFIELQSWLLAFLSC